jgi:hypothetical protein
MANATPSFAGQINGAGDELALFLKIWSGEVLTAFEQATAFLGRAMERTISSGKTAQFPATGRTTASYHTPGTEITGQTIDGNEKTIGIDGLLISDVFLANIDEAMSHFDVRGEYTKQLGYALGKQYDINVATKFLLAARSTAAVTGLPDGLKQIAASAATAGNAGANALVSAILACAQRLDENSVPEQDRYIFLRPAQYWNLFNADKITNRDFTQGSGNDNGSIVNGKIMMIGGIPVVKALNIPSTNVTTGLATYQGDFSTTVGIVAHKSAVGTVKLLDLATESAYDVRRQGTLIVSKYAVGHDVLRCEAACEIATA